MILTSVFIATGFEGARNVFKIPQPASEPHAKRPRKSRERLLKLLYSSHYFHTPFMQPNSSTHYLFIFALFVTSPLTSGEFVGVAVGVAARGTVATASGVVEEVFLP